MGRRRSLNLTHSCFAQEVAVSLSRSNWVLWIGGQTKQETLLCTDPPNDWSTPARTPTFGRRKHRATPWGRSGAFLTQRWLLALLIGSRAFLALFFCSPPHFFCPKHRLRSTPRGTSKVPSTRTALPPPATRFRLGDPELGLLGEGPQE